MFVEMHLCYLDFSPFVGLQFFCFLTTNVLLLCSSSSMAGHVRDETQGLEKARSQFSFAVLDCLSGAI